MSPTPNLIDFSIVILLIEFAGALYVAAYAFAAMLALVRSRDMARARLLVAEGALMGLSIKLAAGLLKTIQLHTWEQIAAFASILALRILLKRLFNWERARLQRT